MEGILATDATDASGADPSAKRLTEVWADNPRMRHIPAVEWIIDKLDRDVRQRIEIVLAPLPDVGAEDPRHAPIEKALRSLCTSLERLAEIARHSRGNHPPADLLAHVTWALNHAVSSIRGGVDPTLFGRRYPIQTFERSKAEPLYATLLAVLCSVDALAAHVRELDPTIDEKLYGSLVKLSEPMRRIE